MIPAVLLDRPRVAGMRLQPEQRLQIEIADQLRAWSLERRLRAVWCAVPNELPIPDHPAGAAIIGAKRKAMGCLPGAGDLVLTWSTGAGWLEVKRPSRARRLVRIKGRLHVRSVPAGRLSPAQKDWAGWCASLGIRHAVVTSADALEPLLTSWGCLAP